MMFCLIGLNSIQTFSHHQTQRNCVLLLKYLRFPIFNLWCENKSSYKVNQ